MASTCLGASTALHSTSVVVTRNSPRATGVRLLTANQVVAINVDAARRRNGLTQLQAVKQLSHYGLKWTRANYAMAVQTTAKGRRVREFSADELIVFAQTFRIAVWAMFIPPRNTVVALPGGGSKLDASAMRHFAYRLKQSRRRYRS